MIAKDVKYPRVSVTNVVKRKLLRAAKREGLSLKEVTELAIREGLKILGL